MSDIDELLHYGVKGMKWGRRKAVVKTPVSLRETPGKRVTAVGGTGQRASADARAAAKSRQKARASTVDALTNKELKALNERMNLEQNYSRLAAADAQGRKGAGRKFLEGMLSGAGTVAGNAGKQQAQQVANQQMSKLMKEMLEG